MKFQFKTQKYQIDAVESVIRAFDGQPYCDLLSYTRDLGCLDYGNSDLQLKLFDEQNPLLLESRGSINEDESVNLGFANSPISLSDCKILENIHRIQSENNLQLDSSLSNKLGRVSLDVEMETGTGKTYVYIRTMFELNRKYGFSKFIVVVPSIAIREGVKKSFEQMESHFMEEYGKKARYFIYDSSRLDKIDAFSSSNSINVMIINVQAFNSKGKGSKEARKIYESLDSFQSRRPIDVIRANRPILILDEPQKMGGNATQEALQNFNPLFVLNYSATHKEHHNLVYVLDALDAYNEKLVKKIQVKGITVKNIRGSNGFVYFEGFVLSPNKAPQVKLNFDIKNKDGSIKRNTRVLEANDNLYQLSNELEEYHDGYTISDIDYGRETVSFLNGITLSAGEGTGDVSDDDIRRIQIRETIESHLDKEEELFSKGIKVLSLFFIDEVGKYRVYDQDGNPGLGVYGRIFEEEYTKAVNDRLSRLFHDDQDYVHYLENIKCSETHKGYFSVDKKGNAIDSVCKRDSDISDDESAYDLILKDKERLLSFEEPTRFIFSHSALREGWDNPNVFQICTLRHTKSSIQKRQEVGRGLRLCVTQTGERMDKTVLSDVFSVNKLTVIANEEYKDFVDGLQSEIKEVLYNRPTKADAAFFKGKTIKDETGSKEIVISEKEANQIYHYLIRNEYINDENQVTDKFREAVKDGTVSDLPEGELAGYKSSIIELVESIYDPSKISGMVENGMKPTILENTLNQNFHKKEFQKLWSAINHKYSYHVDFDSNELIKNCVEAINTELEVSQLVYSLHVGEQNESVTAGDIDAKKGFHESTNSGTQKKLDSTSISIKYDLLGKIASSVCLTRRTIAEILTRITPSKFAMYKSNPEEFISKVSKIINSQKASVIVEHVTYNRLDQTFDSTIFNEKKCEYDKDKVFASQKAIQDFVFLDGNATESNEMKFVKNLETNREVKVFAKLPKGYYIPTPMGKYSPDWAIVYDKDDVRNIYFIAETKGSLDSLELRPIEKAKIECAKKLFNDMPDTIVHYDMVHTYDDLLNIITLMK